MGLYYIHIFFFFVFAFFILAFNFCTSTSLFAGLVVELLADFSTGGLKLFSLLAFCLSSAVAWFSLFSAAFLAFLSFSLRKYSPDSSSLSTLDMAGAGGKGV